MAETELERAEKRLAQAKARVQALRSRETTKQRKLDTRRKVILGGALVELAGRDDGARAMLDRIVRGLAREQDRAAFQGWEPGPERADSGDATGPDAGEGEDRRDDHPGGTGALDDPPPDEATPSPRERHRRTFP